jgi:hypothetical protein
MSVVYREKRVVHFPLLVVRKINKAEDETLRTKKFLADG